MTETTFHPNWASPPAETIQTIMRDRGFTTSWLKRSLALPDSELDCLLTGKLQISKDLAKKLSESLGSTARFWLERDKQYHACVRQLELAAPELSHWVQSFPLGEMVKSGWLTKPSSKEAAGCELLEYFNVSSLTEWKEEYQSRLKHTQFRTSQSFENRVASTTAWIRRGELLAERMNCGPFNKEGFYSSLSELKSLTAEANPRRFIPALKKTCAKYGVAVVVARGIAGCFASGATYVLENGTALLLLSGRFLSDDQFWFSFFHEAGHLVLHTGEACVEEKTAELTTIEKEANEFAQNVILSPATERELVALKPNKFSIARFARRCRVSPGVIVGQLQHRKMVGQTAYNPMKIRYKEEDLIHGNGSV